MYNVFSTDWAILLYIIHLQLREGGRKRRPLTQFSASFLHPVQGVSPAAL